MKMQQPAQPSLFPISAAQRRFWFVEALQGPSPTFTVTFTLRFRRDIDASLLGRAFHNVMAGHAALRARFVDIDGVAQQFFDNSDTIEPVAIYALNGDCDALAHHVQAEARRIFDLRAGPLYHGKILRLTASDCVLLSSFHHIVFDGWSMGIFTNALLNAYESLQRGQAVSMPPPHVYEDYLLAGRSGADPARDAALLAYWRTRLAGASELLPIAHDYPRQDKKLGSGRSLPFVLDAGLKGEIQSACRRLGITTYMFTLTAFALLLARYANQTDIVIGTPVAGRNGDHLAPLIGCFINLLPIRVVFDENATVEAALRAIRTAVLADFRHQDMPFDDLVAAMQHARSAAYTPLFQVLFSFQNTAAASLVHEGVELNPVKAHSGEAMYDLGISLEDRPDRIDGELEYDAALFADVTAQEMVAYYRQILRNMLQGERTMYAASACPAPAPLRFDSVPAAIVRQAQCQPERTAIVDGGEQTSYGALLDQATAVAAALSARRIEPGAMVAVVGERGAALFATLLGIMMHGAAYLPIATGLPEARLRFILDDAVPGLLIGVGAAPLPQGLACPTVDFATLLAQGRGRVPEPADLEPHQLAYAMYTSGTTGTPKAVLVAHGNLAAVRQAWGQAYGASLLAGRHLQMANYTFDVFIGDVVRALSFGGTLVLADHLTVIEPAALFDLMQRSRIDIAEFVPSVARTLMDHVAHLEAPLAFLRACIVGSDIWQMSDHRRLERLCGPGVRVINSYGLTETTIDSCFFERGADEPWSHGVAPIGRPMAHASCHVLGKHGEPIPRGAIGELYIGGPGVALGYLNRPELNAQRFLDDGHGQRLFRTGDLARWRVDGNLEFVGRGDGQVKLRGVRIETAEIESALMQHPAVREAVVVPVFAEPGSKVVQALTAYCTVQEQIAPGEIIDFIKTILPAASVPAHLHLVEHIPRSANGKLVRKDLPVEAIRASAVKARRAPADDVEVQLHAIWRQLLGHADFDTDDDFFSVGGHSLLLARLQHAIDRQWQRQLSMASIFGAPSIAALARLLRAPAAAADDAPAVLREAAAATAQVFLFPPAGGSPLAYRDLVAGIEQPVTVRALALPEGPAYGRMETLEALCAHYAAAIMRCADERPLYLIGWSDGGVLAYQTALCLERLQRTVAHVLLIDSYAPGANPAEYDDLPALDALQFFTHLWSLDGALAARLRACLEDCAGRDDATLAACALDWRKRNSLPLAEPTPDPAPLFAAYRHGVLLKRRYAPACWNGPITLFEAGEGRIEGAPDGLGWAALAPGLRRHALLPGNHYSMLHGPHGRSLGALVGALMDGGTTTCVTASPALAGKNKENPDV